MALAGVGAGAVTIRGLGFAELRSSRGVESSSSLDPADQGFSGVYEGMIVGQRATR